MTRSRELRVRGLPSMLALAAVLLCSNARPQTEVGGSSTAARQPAAAEVQILAFNDFHGHIDAPAGRVRITSSSGAAELPAGGATFLAAKIEDLRATNPRTVVVAAGDLIGASPLDSAVFHDEPTIEALNAMGLEFSSIGNHEFDDGAQELQRMQRGGCDPNGVRGTDTCLEGGFPGARFRYLAANVFDARTGRRIFPGYALRSIALPGGHSIRIGFIGAVLRDTPDLVRSAGIGGLTFGDEADAINDAVPALRAAGAQAVVVLIHQGGRVAGGYDGCNGIHGPIVKIVRRLDPGITAVVSGHTHQAYVCRLPTRDSARRVLTTQAGSYGRFLTRIVLRVDAGREGARVVSAHNMPVLDSAQVAAAAGEDPLHKSAGTVAALVRRYDDAAAPLGRRVVGRIAERLRRMPNPAGESPLGDVVADAQLAATEAVNAGAAQIAFMNPGGLRGDLVPGAEGQVTYADVFGVQPFANHLVTVDLTGRDIRALLEQQWRGDRRGPMLQVSAGFQYAWRDGNAVDHVVPGSLRLQGKRIEADKHYRVTVNDFLTGGGNGFSVLKSAKIVEVGPVDVEATAAYLGAHVPLSPPAGDRIHLVEQAIAPASAVNR